VQEGLLILWILLKSDYKKKEKEALMLKSIIIYGMEGK
jgi:hypothetical protein